MKPKILAIAFLSIAFVTSSFATKPIPSIVTREVALTASFEKIVVGDYLTVVLVQDAKTSVISISGDEKSIQAIDVKMVKKELKISSKKNIEGKKITVYIPVQNVSLIELSNGSSLIGNGVLKLGNLTVIVNDDAHVQLNTLGQVTIKSGNDCEVVYEKNESYKVLDGTF